MIELIVNSVESKKSLIFKGFKPAAEFLYGASEEKDLARVRHLIDTRHSHNGYYVDYLFGGDDYHAKSCAFNCPVLCGERCNFSAVSCGCYRSVRRMSRTKP